MALRVTLSDAVSARCVELGMSRHQYAIDNNLRGTVNMGRSFEVKSQNHIMGAKGEVATMVAFGMDVSEKVFEKIFLSSFMTWGDVVLGSGTAQVKTVPRPGLRLIIPYASPLEDEYVILASMLGIYRGDDPSVGNELLVHGWLTREKWIEKRYLDDVGYGPAWFTDWKDMDDIEILVEQEKEKQLVLFGG